MEKTEQNTVPTATGEVVSDFLSLHFNKYISDDFTAKMEDILTRLLKVKTKYVDVLRDFYTPFLAEVESKKKI